MDCPTCGNARKYWNGLLQEWLPCVDCSEAEKPCQHMNFAAEIGAKMTIDTAGEVSKLARKEGMIDAANIVSKLSDQLMRKGEAHHRREEWDEYEMYEAQATLVEEAAAKIRKAAKRLTPAFCNGGYARSFNKPCACGALGSEACRATFK